MAEVHFAPAKRGDGVIGVMIGGLGLLLLMYPFDILLHGAPADRWLAVPLLVPVVVLLWLARHTYVRGIKPRARMVLDATGVTLWRLKGDDEGTPVRFDWSQISAVRRGEAVYTRRIGFEVPHAGWFTKRQMIWLHDHAFDAQPEEVLAALTDGVRASGRQVVKSRVFRVVFWGTTWRVVGR